MFKPYSAPLLSHLGKSEGKDKQGLSILKLFDSTISSKLFYGSYQVMTSPLKRYLLPSLVAAGTVFSALTLPLAMCGSEQVAIKVNKEPVFYGQMRDVAAPYLGFAAALSLGAAISSVAMTGWRQSSRKSAQIQDQLSCLQQNLKEKEAQLEELKLSELRLQASGLSFFLEDEKAVAQPLTTATSQWEVVTTPVSLQKLAIASPIVEPISAVQADDVESQQESVPQVLGIHSQLQDMKSKLEKLEQVLQAVPQLITETAANSNDQPRRRLTRRVGLSNSVSRMPVRVNIAS